jgi:sec-independent protein translocase protein TatA
MQLLAMIGVTEIAIIAAVVVLLFGSSRIPTLAKSIGQSITEFKKGVKGIEDDSPDAQKLER